MTDTLYRSNKSVPDRVDAAWRKGYEAGLAERSDHRLALVALAVSGFTLWRQVDMRRNSHLLPWAILASAMLFAVALVLALCSVPFVLAALGIRTGYRHHQATVSHRPPGPIVPVVCSPSDEYEPF